MSSFLKEAVKLQEIYSEKEASAKNKFFFVKVSCEKEEQKELNKIEAENVNANVVIVRTDI